MGQCSLVNTVLSFGWVSPITKSKTEIATLGIFPLPSPPHSIQRTKVYCQCNLAPTEWHGRNVRTEVDSHLCEVKLINAERENYMPFSAMFLKICGGNEYLIVYLKFSSCTQLLSFSCTAVAAQQQLLSFSVKQGLAALLIAWLFYLHGVSQNSEREVTN